MSIRLVWVMSVSLVLWILSMEGLFASDTIITTDVKEIWYSSQKDEMDEHGIVNLDRGLMNPLITRKDPFIAGIYSFAWPGIGQIYNEDYYKGSLLFFLDFTQKVLFVGLILNLSSEYGQGDNEVDWLELRGSEKALLVSSLAIYTGFFIYCIVDAVFGAVEYNRKYFGEPSLNLNVYFIHQENMGIQISTKF